MVFVLALTSLLTHIRTTPTCNSEGQPLYSDVLQEHQYFFTILTGHITLSMGQPEIALH